MLVVGVGNSAMDISCELSHRGVAARLVVSTRRSAYVIPKYLFGRPIDSVIRTKPWLPLWPQRMFGSLLIRLAVGRMENYGLPQPKHSLWQTHPTVSSEFLIRLGSGDITVKPNISELAGSEVRFDDGTSNRSTRSSMPPATRSRFRFSIRRCCRRGTINFRCSSGRFIPAFENLIFVGFAQATPSIIKFVEIQSRWLAAYLDGHYALPPADEMQRIMAHDQQSANGHFVSTKRHTMQVDTNLYDWDLSKEWKRGAKRAARQAPESAHLPALAQEFMMNTVVTGAASGIGRRVVTLLAERGHRSLRPTLTWPRLNRAAAECKWPRRRLS